MESKSNLPMIIMTAIGMVIYAAGTYAIIEAAGGTHVSADYSNTPNGTIEGPPAFR